MPLMDYDKHRTSFVLNVLRKSETLKGDKIIEANLKRMEEIQDMDEIVVVGSDVYALYPSLNDIEVAIICYNTILNSDIRFLNFNYWVASKYIAMHLTEVEQRRSPLYIGCCQEEQLRMVSNLE